MSNSVLREWDSKAVNAVQKAVSRLGKDVELVHSADPVEGAPGVEDVMHNKGLDRCGADDMWRSTMGGKPETERVFAMVKELDGDWALMSVISNKSGGGFTWGGPAVEYVMYLRVAEAHDCTCTSRNGFLETWPDQVYSGACKILRKGVANRPR